jgi:2',3'-cyclic-nucleotide 2'-phosphodiesterase/3'-nucleotidase
MRIIRSIAIVSLLCLLLVGCSGRRGVVNLRIIATTDVHGRIYDKDIIDGQERQGSLAKLATYLKKQRKENKNVLYLDAGDILQGSFEIYQDVTAQFERKSLAAQAYNLLGCDAVAFGNHDFAVGTSCYERFYDGTTFPILSSNVCFADYGDFVPVCRMFEFKGLRVAVVGMTTPVTKYSIPSDRIAELEFRDIVETAGFIVPRLREDKKADVIIGLIHSGFAGGRMDDEGVYENAVRRVVSEVAGFDVIIFGHDHTPRCLKITDCNGDSVLLINPGPYAQNAAVATLTADFRKSDKPEILTSGYLEDITDEVPDNDFMKKLSGWYYDGINYADSVAGRITTSLEGRGVLWRGSSAMDYVHSVQMSFNAAEISLASPVFTRTYIPAGDIRMRDLFAMYQYENTMVSVMLKGSEVRDVLEYSAGLYYNTVKDANGNLLKTRTDEGNGKKMPSTPANYLITAAGIDYEIDVTKPEGERVRVLSMNDGKPFDPDRYYRTTINSFLYGGTESALFKATGITHKSIVRRLEVSSSTDIRYYMITDFTLKRKAGKDVNISNVCNWKLVPEGIVEGCLARDTIDFYVINE